MLGAGGGGGTPTVNSPTTGNAGVPYAPQTSQIAQLLGSGTPRSELAGYLWGGTAPQLGAYGLQGALGNYALGISPYALGLTGAELQTSAGFTFARAMLGYQGLGLESQTLAREAGTAAAQQGVEQAQYALTSTRYPQEQQEAALAYRTRQLGLQSGAAGAGTLNTEGAKNAQTTAAQQYAWQQATIYRAQQLAALGQQSEQLGYATKAGGLANAQQQLALAAQGQGVDVQQSMSQLGWGLSQLGIKSTPLQLLQTITSAQGGAATVLKGALSAGSLIGGLGPTFGQTQKG